MPIPRAALAAALAVVLVASGACGTTQLSPAPTMPALTPVPTVNAALVAFRARADAALEREGQIVRDLAEASAGGNPGAMGQPAAALEALADAELAWAADNPADPCYADAHAAFVAGATTLGEAGEQFRALAQRPPASAPPDGSEPGSGGSGSGGPGASDPGASDPGASEPPGLDPAEQAAAQALVDGAESLGEALRLADAARATCS